MHLNLNVSSQFEMVNKYQGCINSSSVGEKNSQPFVIYLPTHSTDSF